MLCSKCQQPLDTGAAFCGNCGQPVRPIVPPVSAPVQPVGAVAPAVPQSGQPVAPAITPASTVVLPAQPYAAAAPMVTPGKGKASWALALAVAGCALSLWNILPGLVFIVGALVLGIMSRKSARRGQAIAAIVIAAIAILLDVLSIIAVIHK